jgi:hypothetical protein
MTLPIRTAAGKLTELAVGARSLHVEACELDPARRKLAGLPETLAHGAGAGRVVVADAPELDPPSSRTSASTSR